MSGLHKVVGCVMAGPAQSTSMSGWRLLPSQECKAEYRCPECDRIFVDARLMSMQQLIQSQMQRSQAVLMHKFLSCRYTAAQMFLHDETWMQACIYDCLLMWQENVKTRSISSYSMG